MAKIIVTKELGETINLIRTQNHILAKDLSSCIEKSPSFISKLENGSLLTIKDTDLTKILSYITNNNDVNSDALSQIIKTLRIKYSDEEIEGQTWFSNFDTVIRTIEIPERLISSVNEYLIQFGISRDYLLSRINNNESLSDEVKSTLSKSPNKWFSKDGNGQSIYINITKERLDGILNQKCHQTNYMTLFAIVFYMFKISAFKDQVIISDEDYGDLYHKAEGYLQQYKVYRIADRGLLVPIEELNDETLSMLPAKEKNTRNNIISIAHQLDYLSTIDIGYASPLINTLDDNLKWDITFILNIVNFDSKKLHDLSYTKKKELLSKIKALIDDYSNQEQGHNNIEKY